MRCLSRTSGLQLSCPVVIIGTKPPLFLTASEFSAICRVFFQLLYKDLLLVSPGLMTSLCPEVPQQARCCTFWKNSCLFWQPFSMAMLFFPGVALSGNFFFPPLVAAPVKHCSGCRQEEELQHKATVFGSKTSNSSELWLGGNT